MNAQRPRFLCYSDLSQLALQQVMSPSGVSSPSHHLVISLDKRRTAIPWRQGKDIPKASRRQAHAEDLLRQERQAIKNKVDKNDKFGLKVKPARFKLPR